MKKSLRKIVFLVCIILYTGLIFLSAQSSSMVCNRGMDSLELIKFYHNFDGNNWIDNTNWLINGKPINTWKGVKLSSQGCVVSLILEGNNLQGNMIDPLLGNLKTLNLSKNSIGGFILDFANMPLLDTLILAENKLSGSLPDFNNLPSLDDLELKLNQISGKIPDFSKVPNLSTIDIADNFLSGEIPDFSKMKKLGTLWLDGNQLSGKVPDFSNLPELGSLYIGRNNFDGNLPLFTKIPKLWFLSLGDNNFTGTIPDFVNLPKLYLLDLSNNNLTGEIPDFNLPNLYSLYLRVNQLSGPVPNFSNTIKMFFADLGSNKLTGRIPDFAHLPELNSVWLYDNCLSGPIPNTPFVKWFHYYGNKFTFSDILASGKKSPTYYYYRQQDFYSDTVILVAKSKSLTIDLGIDDNITDNNYRLFLVKDNVYNFNRDQDSNKIFFPNPQATDAGRYTVRVTNPNLPQLQIWSKTISLKVCDRQKDSSELVKLYNATGGPSWTNHSNWLIPDKPISSWYGIKTNNLGCVEKIELSNNNLQGSLPLIDLNTLDTAIFENNQLTGKIPEVKIPFIKNLNLSQNNISGPFPKELTNWDNIQNLNVSQNQISGGVPPDLGDLCELRALRINNNKLDGELPDRLTMLTNLEIGEVDFGNNNIDSLNNKMIWFCPYGDSIFRSNPSYDRFLGICNVKCNGKEFNSLKDFPWMVDTIEHLNCKINNCALTEAQAGFVDVRGVKVFYTLSRCYSIVGPPSTYETEVNFYDCGGHLLETVNNSSSNVFNIDYGSMTLEQFQQLIYDVRWQCGEKLNITTGTNNPSHPNKSDYKTKTFKLTCSPNPASVVVHCETNEVLNLKSLQVFDHLGKKHQLKSTMSNDQLMLDVNSLEQGIYFISVMGEKDYYVGKIIIQ